MDEDKLIIKIMADVSDLKDGMDKVEKSVQDGTTEIKEMDKAIGKIDDGNEVKNLKTDLEGIEDIDLGGVMDGLLGQMDSPSLGKLAGAFSAAIPFGNALSGIAETVLGQIEESWKKIKEHQEEAAILAASTDFLGEDKVLIMQEAIDSVQTYGVEGSEALIGVRKQFQLNKDASNEANISVIKGASAIATKYKSLDFSEIITEANKVGSALNVTDQEAVSLLNHLLDAGFPEEHIDTVAEYGKQLDLAGYSAEEITAILLSAVDVEPWNMDNMLDGLKEGRIQMAEFGGNIDDTMGSLIEQAGWSKTEFQQLGKDIAAGGEAGTEAYNQVAAMLGTVEDKTLQNQLGVQIFGTMWEDNGSDIIDTLNGMESKLESASGAQQNLNNDIAQLDDTPTIKQAQAAEAQSDAYKGLGEEYLNTKLANGEYVSEAERNLLGLDKSVETHTFRTSMGMEGVRQQMKLNENETRELEATTKDSFSNMNTAVQEEGIDMVAGISDNFNSMETKADSSMDNVKRTVNNGLGEIKNDAKNLNWQISRPSIPTFNMSGSFNAQTGTVPKVTYSWQARGGIFKKPTLFPNSGIGVGDASNGFGSSPEVVAPLSDLKQMLGLNDSNKGNVTINLNGNYSFRDKADMDYLMNRMALATRRK